MYDSAPWKTEETIVGLPGFGGCHLSPLRTGTTHQRRAQGSGRSGESPFTSQDWHHTPKPGFPGVRLNAANRTRSASSVGDAASRAVKF